MGLGVDVRGSAWSRCFRRRGAHLEAIAASGQSSLCSRHMQRPHQLAEPCLSILCRRPKTATPTRNRYNTKNGNTGNKLCGPKRPHEHAIDPSACKIPGLKRVSATLPSSGSHSRSRSCFGKICSGRRQGIDVSVSSGMRLRASSGASGRAITELVLTLAHPRGLPHTR